MDGSRHSIPAIPAKASAPDRRSLAGCGEEIGAIDSLGRIAVGFGVGAFAGAVAGAPVAALTTIVFTPAVGLAVEGGATLMGAAAGAAREDEDISIHNNEVRQCRETVGFGPKPNF
jgi:hypothetical protein